MRLHEASAAPGIWLAGRCNKARLGRPTSSPHFMWDSISANPSQREANPSAPAPPARLRITRTPSLRLGGEFRYRNRAIPVCGYPCPKLSRKWPAKTRFRAQTADIAIKGDCLAGAGGFEPPYGGIKIRCLTTWRRPNRRADHSETDCASQHKRESYA